LRPYAGVEFNVERTDLIGRLDGRGEGRTWVAERHVAHLPLCVRIHRVAPGACGETRIWIAAEVVSEFDAAVSEHRVGGVFVLVR